MSVRLFPGYRSRELQADTPRRRAYARHGVSHIGDKRDFQKLRAVGGVLGELESDHPVFHLLDHDALEIDVLNSEWFGNHRPAPASVEQGASSPLRQSAASHAGRHVGAWLAKPFRFLPSALCANSRTPVRAFYSRHTGRDPFSRDIGAGAFARLCSGKLGIGTRYGASRVSEQLPATNSRRAAETGAVPTQQTRKHCPGLRRGLPQEGMAG